MCMAGVRVSARDVRLVLVGLRLMSTAIIASLDEKHGALRVLKAFRTEKCVVRERWFYAGQKAGAQKNLLNGLALLREKSNGTMEVCTEKRLLPFGCLMSAESES